MEIGIFLSGGLDRANQLECASEIGLSARVTFACRTRASAISFTKSHSRFARRARFLRVMRNILSAVMAALVAAIHVFRPGYPV
ncbi:MULTISPECIES: hypothetical protein [unclassified Bradyrhizobium]|uniref:hypothetical protein n=1 Tax=unclassified Bradyrhizobium TaxID=2631580 RepID=UPI002916719D|nr:MULTISPECIES: hypothetical protein [unclassified Bradyrhizobium]